MHQAPGADDFTAEIVTDGLGTETDAENGFFARKGPDHIEGNTGFGRGAGPWRDEDAVGI